MCYTQHMEEVWSLSNHLCFHEKAVVIINNRTKKLKWEEEAYILPHWFVLLERKVNGNVSYAEDFQKLFFFWVSFKKIMLEATCWVCGTGSVSITMAPEHSSKWLTSKANETEAESQQALWQVLHRPASTFLSGPLLLTGFHCPIIHPCSYNNQIFFSK